MTQNLDIRITSTNSDTVMYGRCIMEKGSGNLRDPEAKYTYSQKLLSRIKAVI
jgi:hypothetical protein